MQLTTPQHYLVKPNESFVYYFFINNDKTLVYNVYTSNNTILKDEKLITSVIEFSVIIDIQQKIHLICITTKGELLYYINQNDSWSYKTISTFDIRSNIYRHLSLHIDDNYTHIIYTKTNILNRALSTIEHIYWNNKNIYKSIITSYVHGKYSSPIQISVDSFKNIHIVYKVYYKSNYQLYYCKFNIFSKVWSTGELLTDLQEDHSHPYIFIDTNNNLHLVWCSIEQNNFILKYKRKANIINTKSKWSNVQTLSNENANNLSPILLQKSNFLKIYCKQNEQIIEIISEDFGNTWINSTSNKPYFVENATIVHFSNNLQHSLLAKHIYGNITDTIKIIGVDLFIDNKKSQTLTTELNLSRNYYALDNINIDKKTNEKNDLDKDLANLIKDISIKIDSILLQIIEHETITDSLFSNYNLLDQQFINLKHEKENIINLITNYENNINFLEEKIIDFNNKILTIQKQFNKDCSCNSGIFKRFINFLK